MPRSPRLLSSPPAFFLADAEDAEEPRLCAQDEQHALQVLRLTAGDLLIGMDGRGGLHPLRVRAVRKRALELEVAGQAERVPAPGEEGSSIPWFEVAVAWPRRNRVEDMLNGLVQLGAAAIRPLLAQQRGPEEVPEDPPERWLRVAREACKQSGRAWLPRFEEACTPQVLLEEREPTALCALDPRAGLALDVWLRSLHPSPLALGIRSRPIGMAVGPEGGWSTEERRGWLDGGVALTWIGSHVLRVETAALAAMAVAAALHGRPPTAPVSA